jgi:uncharacterized protein (TIGR03086 family)
VDTIARVDASTAHAAKIVKGVSTADFSKDTPCSEYDVKALLEHMIGGLAMLASAAETGKGVIPETVDIADPAARYEEGRARLLASLRGEGVLAKQLEMPFGTIPAEMMFATIAFPEHLLHGWDLAKATGQDGTIPDDLAQEALDTLTPIEGMLRGPGVYGPKIDVPDDASLSDRLVAFSGRQP